MLYCPSCGTANRKGSKYCNECGLRLGSQPQGVCSHCGASNPIEAPACVICGQALPLRSGQVGASSPATGPSEPVPPADAAGRTPGGDSVHPKAGTQVPGWLRGLPPRSEEPGRTAQTSIEADSSAAPWTHGDPEVASLWTRPRSAPNCETPDPQEKAPLSRQARQFAAIVAPASPAQPPAKARSRPGFRARLLPWTLAAVLIVAVTLPLLEEPWLGNTPLAGLAGFPFERILPSTASREIRATPATAELYAAIESLDSAARVLVAFDYDPSSLGEMDPIAESLINHLLDRNVTVVAISLVPGGPATAQRLWEQALANQAHRVPGGGQPFANLGYLPGQAAAVRLLGKSLLAAVPADFAGTPLANLPAMAGFPSVDEGLSLADFDLILELAATPDTLRWWIEQASTPYAIPLAAGVSAATEPLALSYYETNPRLLTGLVAGVPGAAIYQSLRQGEMAATSLQGGAAAQLDSLLAGHLVLIAILLIGNGLYLLRRLVHRSR
jgi:hypothetical protein